MTLGFLQLLHQSHEIGESRDFQFPLPCQRKDFVAADLPHKACFMKGMANGANYPLVSLTDFSQGKGDRPSIKAQEIQHQIVVVTSVGKGTNALVNHTGAGHVLAGIK